MGITVLICGGEPPDDEHLDPTPNPPEPPPFQCHTFAQFRDHGPKLLGLMNEYLLDINCEAAVNSPSQDTLALCLGEAFSASHANLVHAYHSNNTTLVPHECFALSALSAMWNYAVSFQVRGSQFSLVTSEISESDIRQKLDEYLGTFPPPKEQWQDIYVTLACNCYTKIIGELKYCTKNGNEVTVFHHLNVLLDILCEMVRIHMFRRPQLTASQVFQK
ncbi:hypothetical protein [Gimesia sp.]|uniref:hypothetical protein n=1 Tax=Gimesia sp. TaxID=2024833 RepID=UPI003A926494